MTAEVAPAPLYPEIPHGRVAPMTASATGL